jgi:hypothetical protein
VLNLRAILRLTRLDNSLLGFLAIFLPLLVRTNDVTLSLGKAIPLLFICMCTFIANDLDDLEKDRVNHPDRPLPMGHLSPALATVLYFTCLGFALFLTKHYVAPGIDFLYYALTALSISYGYVVDCIPSLKAPYVAVASSIPVLIVAASYPNEPGLYLVAGSAFLITTGREMCGDIEDRAGDTISYLNRFRPTPLAVVAFSLQMVGLFLLIGLIRQPRDIIGVLVMSFLLALSGVYWFKFLKFRLATVLMKLQFFVGIYFLC